MCNTIKVERPKETIDESKILEKIERLIPNFKTFEKRIIDHVKNKNNNYFPLIYQCLYERIMPMGYSKFSTDDFKKLLNNNYLRLLNDIYRTRISEKAFDIILKRLDKVNNFDDYKVVLEQFQGCNRRGNKNTNAFSLGTKVLHTYNPEENPIMDSVIRKNLNIKPRLNIDLCMNFKKAMNCFAKKHEKYFSLLENNNHIKLEFKEFHLKPKFPKMKILDMALYYK